MINKNSKIFIAGHRGMVGSAIHRCLVKNGYKKIFTRKRVELDLTDNSNVMKYLKRNKFDIIICCAAQVGGIQANATYQGDFIMRNLEIQNNLIINAFKLRIKKINIFR